MDETSDVLERYVAAWNDQDGDRLAALYYPDAERASPLGTARGGTDIRAAAERLWRAAPDGRITITHWAARGSVVLYEFTDDGTHTGPLATPGARCRGAGGASGSRGRGCWSCTTGGLRRSGCTSIRVRSCANSDSAGSE